MGNRLSLSSETAQQINALVHLFWHGKFLVVLIVSVDPEMTTILTVTCYYSRISSENANVRDLDNPRKEKKVMYCNWNSPAHHKRSQLQSQLVYTCRRLRAKQFSGAMGFNNKISSLHLAKQAIRKQNMP